MLFMGEEYGEPAPFQFFTDHIDEEIAIATREGRRREFASFARFAGEEVPDPQDPATFERSKLTRVEDPALRELYTALLRARRLLPRGPVDEVTGDEDGRWVRVRRGGYALLMNFDEGEQRVACDGQKLVLGTHDGVALDGGAVVLPPLSGALVEAPMSRESWPGEPFPLGPVWDGQGTNFSIFSENAERVELCLFDRDGNEERVEVTRPRTTGTATCRASGPDSDTATACTGRTRRTRAIASTPPSC